MSTPGAGGPQPPEQDPSQPAQPDAGQQPPAGQPWGPPPQQQWGAPQPQPQPQPQQPWGAPQQPAGQAFGQPEKPKRMWLPILGAVIGALVVLALLSTFLGGNSAEAGDCVNDEADEIGVVACDSDEAAFKVAGVVEDVSQNELNNDPAACQDWPNWVAYAWEGSDPDDLDSEGTGYCLEELTD